MIPLSKITGKHSSGTQTKYNRRIPLSQIIGNTSPQEETKEDSGGFFDTVGNAVDWWKNNSLAGAGYLGGLLSETAGNALQNLSETFGEDTWRRRALEGAGDIAQSAADKMLDFATNRVYVANGDNFSGAFANQLMSGLTGAYGNLASMIHSDKTADAMKKTSESTANKTPISTDNLTEYFTNPRGLTSDFGQLAGSMAAIAPFMELAPIGAVTRGVAAFGGDAITQALINRGLYNAAKVFAGGAPRAAQYGLTSVPIEGAMEGGETRRELLNQGASEEEATKESLITMGKNIPLLLATNTLEGLAFFSPLRGANKALQITGRAAANSAQEQYEEFAQEGIQNAARGEPYGWLPWNGAPNQYEAAERVRYPALLLGGFGGAAQALGGRNENQENFERGSQENISVEDYSARANLTAKQAEIWDAAQYASARAKEKFGYDISPELIYKQWAHEAGANFDSENAKYNNNFGGLTQIEPNGEENKQPDGNNYYRHFNNVREYADAYVDDFIKYYPEISGAKNEREFASVLKSYGYFGDDLENYVAGMEGIQTPAHRTSGNQPKIDFASGLQSARKSLDGKQMDNGTVGCVEAVTKILSHVHPEFKKMVDDGVVNTVEGENSLKSRLEKMGVEIIPFDESNVAQGDIIFYDGEQTYQHVLIADHQDADGNWRVFGNSSSANKIMEQPLYQGQTPAWIAKVSNLSGANPQTQSQTQRTNQEEPSKPLFDINTEDSTTQKLLEKFATERFSKAVDEADAEPVNFFNGMFDDKDNFQNTPENRNAIITRYGDEFKTWSANQNQNQQEQPQKQTQPKKQTQPQKENSFDNGFPLKQAVDQLKAKATQEHNTVLLLQLNRAENNPAELKNILEQNGVKISQPQPQQDPVTQNQSPENILAQPKQKSSPLERKIKVASASVKTGNKGLKSRKKQGTALIDLATQNGIEIPNPEVIALTKGSTKAVQKWRDNLMQAGAFKVAAPQTQENSPTLKERAQKILEQSAVKETSTKADNVRAAQADEQARQAQERARQESATQSLQAGELAQQELAQTTAQNLQSRQRPEPKPASKTQSVQTAQADAQALQAQEEYRRRQAEQSRQANEQAMQSFGQTQSQSVQRQKQNYGRTTTAVTDSKTKYPVRYKVVEADELNTSHKIEGLGVVPNADYRGIQPRDRERVGMQHDLLETAKNFDPDLALDTALSVNSGAPIVRNDNVVLNGNGRTIANRYAYENGNGDAYKNALIQNAQIFGLDTNAISKMNRPILVREVVGDLGEKEMRDIAGATAGGSGMSSSEQAHSDAKKISSEAIANFAQDEIDFNAPNLSEATKNLATSVLQNIATPAELNGYSDANGQISKAGITRAKNAIAAYAYGKSDVLNRMSESTDDNIKNITAALTNAAPDVAKIRAGMQNDSLHKYDLNFIADAAGKLSDLRNDDKKTVSDYLNEIELGDTGLSAEAREVLSFFDKNKRSTQKISDFIKGIAKNIREQGDPQQGSLFGESEPAPLIDLIKRARQEVESQGEQDLFAQEEMPAPKVESAQEEKKPKRKSKGKWHTIGSANSREDLQKFMQSHGMTVQITPDGKLITSDGKTLSDKIRVTNKGRWQYGYYETADEKHSARGEVDTRIENFVDEKDLTPQQKLLKSFGEKLGVKTIFFRNEDGDFHGAHANGTTYINVNSKMPLGKVFWHESLHWLKKNNADLYDELVKAANITDEQRDAYLEQTGRNDLTTNAEIDEEIIADQFEDVAKRTGLLQNIAGKNRGLIERVVQWLKDTMNKFIAHFRNPQGKLTTEQSIRLADEFGKIAKDLVDANGQKIFRYNRRTHNIEPASIASPENEKTAVTVTGSKNYSLTGAQDSVAKRDDEYLQAVNDFKKATTDEQRRSTFKKLQDMVQRAAEETGFHNAVPEQTVAYKVRITAAPKKTVKVYKVFTVADDGSPTALFVGGTEKLPQGVWLDAQDAWHFKAKNGKYYVPSTQNPFTKGGKTGASVEIPDEATRQELIKRGFLPKGSKATKITALAYRPGWHAGTLPFFPQGGVKPKKGTTSAYPNIHRYNQVVFECELAAEKNFTAEAEAQPKARTKDGKLNTREADLQYMPKNGFYYYATNPLTHGHPELGMWAISGSLKINRALTQEECNKILAEHNKAPQEWEQGKLNLADLGYTGEQNDAARKTLAPITYDDNGEVIPLSQRFDASKDDIRYSFAGMKAKNASTSKLVAAKQMEKSGANRDEIYNATGWFKGKDNKWRFEIPDNFDKIDFDKLLKNNENFFSLDKIYDNPALFAAYPQLRKVLVRSKQLKSPETYGYTNGTEITLNRSKINDEREEAGKTLVHEIQHVIQDYEKFSGGGSDSNVLTTLKNNMAMIKDTVKAIPNGKKSLKPLSEAFSAARFAREMGEDEAELLQDAEDTIKIIKKGFSPTNWQKIKYLAERHSELSDAIDGIRDAKGEYIIVDHEDGSETEEPLQPRLKYEAYERLGGEQEARAVGERLFNRNGTPKPHDEDALIIFGGNTYGMIKQSENKKRPSINGDGELVKDGAMREIFPPSAVTADGTTKRQSPAKLKVTRDNKGGVGTSGNSVDTNSPNGSISQSEEPVKYSFGNSDNSSESLTQKIKNKMSAYFDDSRPSARRDKRIKDTLQKITGYRNLFSHTNSDETIVDDFNKLIQAKHAYEWEKLLPQIGGKIAQRLKLNPNSEQSNYIADWLLTGALNNTSAEAKNFQKAMRENPEVAQLLQDVRNTFQEISDMSALERYKSKIVHKEKKPLIQRLWGERKNLIEQWFDDLHPIKRMVRQMKETATPQVAKMIDEMIDPYKIARLVRGKGALADLMIEAEKENIEAVRNAFREQNPFMKFDRLKSLAMIIEEAGGKENLEDFEAFCVAKLDKEIYEKNRANPNGKQITPMLTEEDADAAIKAGEKKFGTAQRSLVTYSNILLTMQFNAGLISQKQYSGIIKGWKNYVPMARVFDENEDFDFSNSLERKVGSKRDTFSPIAKLICNTQEFIAQAERNKVKLELANIVHCGGFGEILADVENRNPDVKDIITYKENGQTKYLQVADLTIKRAIDSMQTKSESTWLMKTLHSTSRFMRACLTLANPDYAIGNIFRDMVDAFIHNKNLDANPFVAAMEVWRAGFREVVGKKKSQDYIDWLANGGSQSGFITEDIDTAERSINKITGNTSRFGKVLDGFYQLAEVSEYATRLNTYKTSKAKLAAKRADGKATIEDKRNAALMSRDASIDFAKAGRSGRQLNRLLLFSNAALQSLSLWGQKLSPAKLKTKEGRKEAASAVFRAVAMGIIPAILQAVLRNSDDDWKKKYKQAHDWEKDTYWIFGDVKVPKGMDLSIRLMSAFTDEVLDKMIDDDPVEFDRIKKAFIDAAPSLTATIFTPTIEAMANYSFFREAPIVPYSEQHLPKHLQYGSNTSSVAKLTGEIFGASPRKIDYLINGYFGFMGRTGSRIPDFFQRGMTLDEVPMLRRFYFNPYKNPKVVKDFYEAYDEQEELLKGYKLERRKGEKVSLPEEYDAALHKRLQAAQDTMRKISKAQKAILDNPKLSFSERQEKIQALEKRRIALCEKVFKRAQ